MADSIITMMRCAETIGPKYNMDHGFEPQELSYRFDLPEPRFLQSAKFLFSLV